MLRMSRVVKWTPRYTWSRHPSHPAFPTAAVDNDDSRMSNKGEEALPSGPIRRNVAFSMQPRRPQSSTVKKMAAASSPSSSDSTLSSGTSPHQQLLLHVEDALRRYRQANSVQSKRAMKFDMQTQLVPRVAAALLREEAQCTSSSAPAVGGSVPARASISAEQPLVGITETPMSDLATVLRMFALLNVEDGRPIAVAYGLLWRALSSRPRADARGSPTGETASPLASSNSARPNHSARPAREALLSPNTVCAILSSASRIGFFTDDSLTILVENDVLRQLRVFSTGHMLELLVSLGRFSLRDEPFDKVAAALERRKDDITPAHVRPLQVVELLRQLSMAPGLRAHRRLVRHLTHHVLLPHARARQVSPRVLHYVCKLLEGMDARDAGLEEAFLQQARRKGIMADNEQEEEERAFYDVVTADLVKIEHAR